jgi:hypothetical protein
VRLDTSTSDVEIRTDFLAVLVPFYKHCGSRGQAECGSNWAFGPGANFKPAFEIETTQQTAIVNHR